MDTSPRKSMEMGEKTVESCRAKMENVDPPRMVRRRKKEPMALWERCLCVILTLLYHNRAAVVEW